MHFVRSETLTEIRAAQIGPKIQLHDVENASHTKHIYRGGPSRSGSILIKEGRASGRKVKVITCCVLLY